jgi:hypothetical protein
LRPVVNGGKQGVVNNPVVFSFDGGNANTGQIPLGIGQHTASILLVGQKGDHYAITGHFPAGELCFHRLNVRVTSIGMVRLDIFQTVVRKIVACDRFPYRVRRQTGGHLLLFDIQGSIKLGNLNGVD